ncbi:MAG: GNAT family N-acetyltransferase [Chloroflexi bacterium]|nr:GNAT family N-acetyltransferase [Chloroflexota bacterium]
MITKICNYQPGDEPAILELFRAADEMDKVERGMSAIDLQEWMTAPHINPSTDFFIARADGHPVGFIGVDSLPGQCEAHYAFCNGVVHPDNRRQGVGAPQMQTAETRALEIMRDFPPGLPKKLNVFCRDTQTTVKALFEARGMTPARYFLTMQCDLRTELPIAPVPDGLVIRQFRPGDGEAAYAAFEEAFQDHWGYEPLPLEVFRHDFLDAPHFRPELWLLAWDGDQAAGFNFNFVNPGYIERVGRKEGHVAEVGVRRPWRKRGLATALLTQTLRLLREAGMDYALLGVDAENPYQAGRLYENVGFRETRRNVVYRKTLE